MKRVFILLAIVLIVVVGCQDEDSGSVKTSSNSVVDSDSATWDSATWDSSVWED